MMEPARAFQDLLIHAKRIRSSPEVRALALQRVEEFRIQALCDFDRRKPADEIRYQWREFENEMRGSGFIEALKKDDALWPTISSFVGYFGVPKIQISPSKAIQNIEPYDLLREMRAKAARLKLGQAEGDVLDLGLSFLISESQKARNLRDIDAIKKAWRKMWPILSRHGLLDHLRADPQLKGRLMFFLKNSF